MDEEIINLELTDEEKSALLPCPFCGSTEIELCNTWTASYWMKCQNCGCQMDDPNESGDPSLLADHEVSKSAVIKVWNTRTS